MPFKSQAQARLFYAKANSRPGKSRKISGPSAETARKFIADSDHQKIGKLPERVKK